MRRRPCAAAAGLYALLWMAAAPAPASNPVPEGDARVSVASAATGEGAPPGAGPGAPGASDALDLPTPPVRERLLRSWRLRGASAAERAERTREVGLALGLRSLEDPARALLLGAPAVGAGRLRAANAAARLAPDLPLAHGARSLALWQEEGDVPEALRALRRAAGAAAGHLEARLWLEAAGWRALLRAAALGALLFLGVAGAALLPGVVRDLGGLLPGMPPPARCALVVAALLAPAAAGEGAAGVGLALAALGLAYGRLPRRLATGAAALLLVAALHPLADRAQQALGAPAADPVAHAAWKAERGAAGAEEWLRLEAAPEGDRLAERARALRDKRAGRLAEAEARFRALLAEREEPRLLNNAANLDLVRGRPHRAVSLYERALSAGGPSPVILFNLSQALGRAVELEEQERVLARAQALDAERLARLQESFGSLSEFAVADLPLEASRAQARLRRSGAPAGGAPELRRALAPGRLGAGVPSAGWGLAVALAAAGALGRARRRWGRRGSEDGDLYAGIARLLQGPGATDPGLRVARLAELRRRQARRAHLVTALSLVLPGAAGVLLRRPLLGLAGTLAFAGAVACALEALRPLPEPLVLGGLGPALFAAAAVFLALGHLAALALALALGERS